MFLDQKDPAEVLDYTINWLAVLGADTILSSDWDVPTGITKDSDSESSTTTTIWVSGGTAGTDYYFTNTIATAAGRTWQRTFTIPVRNL